MNSLGMAPSAHRSASSPDGSRLCQSCGLCCQGLLHTCAKVYNDEIEAVERLGLPVHQRGDGHHVFPLPCSQHKDDKCMVYENRPKACRIYRCKLLKRYLGGEINFEASLTLVKRAKELIAEARGRLKVERGESSIWDQLSSFFSEHPLETRGEVAGDVFLMDMAELSALCRGQFKNRDEARKVMTH